MDSQGNYVTPIVKDAPTIPFNPSPSDSATNQSVTVDVSWGGGDCDSGDVVTYDVYLAANDSTADVLVYTGENATYDPGTLSYCTRYFWKVIATDNSGLSTEGPVWSFTTESAPEVSLSARSHSFGNVRVGESTNWTFTVTNNGCADLTVNNIISNHGDFVITSPTFPKMVPADGHFVVTGRFTPSSMGTKSGTLTITSIDPDEGTKYVSVSGVGLVPGIAVSSNSQDFGDVLADSSSLWMLIVYNAGDADLTVDSVTSDHPNFIVASPTFPQTIAPADSVSAEVVFTPSPAGVKTAGLTVFSDDPDEGVVNISLSGRGVVPDIAVSTTDHDFGTVVVDSSESWILTLSNVGTSDLTVQSVTSNHSDFVVASPTFPHVVGPGDSAAVTPFLYTWDGQEWMEENNLLPASEDSTRTELDVTDYYLLGGLLVPEKGKYRLQISEFEQEHSWLDQVGLVVVDHDPAAEAGVTPDGQILTYGNPKPPLAATDGRGVNQTAVLEAKDYVFFEGGEGDVLTLRFGPIQKRKKLGKAVLVLSSQRPEPLYAYDTKGKILVGPAEGDVKEITAAVMFRQNMATQIVDVTPWAAPDREWQVSLRWQVPYLLDWAGLSTARQV
ncbi:MAG: choice-of-anchor D domain-containing protein, partial [bacterium]